MEETKMKKEKKELVKKFKVVIEDLLDNYDVYTDEEKAQLKGYLHALTERQEKFNKHA